MSGSALMMQCCCETDIEVCGCIPEQGDTKTISLFWTVTRTDYGTSSQCNWNRTEDSITESVETYSTSASFVCPCYGGGKFAYENGQEATISGEYSKVTTVSRSGGQCYPICAPPYDCPNPAQPSYSSMEVKTAGGSGTVTGANQSSGSISVSGLGASSQIFRGGSYGYLIPFTVREAYGGPGWTAVPDHYYRRVSGSISVSVDGSRTYSQEQVNCMDESSSSYEDDPMGGFNCGVFSVSRWYDLGPTCDIYTAGQAMAAPSIGPINNQAPFSPYFDSSFQQGPDGVCPPDFYCSCTAEGGQTRPGYTDSINTIIIAGISSS